MSLSRYPEYKNSGVGWLGEVPAHWRLAKIKTFSRFCGGGTPSRENLDYWNGSVPWVSPKDMKTERIASAEECITDAGLSACASPLIEAGGLLMVVRSGILKHTIPVAINDVPVAMNQDMKALRFIEESVTSDFFLRWVQGLNDLLLLAWAKQGATVESIEHAYLIDTLMPLPPIEEQATITTFLDRETAKIDALIAEQEKLLALLAEKRQATISHAVTRGLDPNAPMKDSGIPWLGEVPAHWALVPCRFLVSERDERNEGAANKNYLSLMANVGVVPYAEKGDVGNRKPEDLSKCKLVEVGDLVINSMNYGIGSYGLSPLSGVCSPVYIVLEVKQSAALRGFVYRIFQNRGFQLFAQSFGNGILAHRAAIGWDTLKGLQVVLPSLGEQREIVEFVKSVEDTERQMRMEGEQAIALLRERRSALIAAAVTGQIDVRGLVEAQAT